MSKKKLIETSGKEETTELTSLEQIFGYNELSRYETLDIVTYDTRLGAMNRTDLENEARRVGTMIVEDTARLRNNLVKEFHAYVASLRKPVAPPNRNKPVSKEVMAILNEGR